MKRIILSFEKDCLQVVFYEKIEINFLPNLFDNNAQIQIKNRNLFLKMMNLWKLFQRI